MRTKTLKPIPLSRATTAYGLVVSALHAVEEEHRRVDMTATVSADMTPACGTVGCIGGWIALKARGRTACLESGGNLRFARKILGADVSFMMDSGEGYAFDVFNAGDGDACGTTRPGTKAHARAVAVRIRRFLKVNATALKARKLVRRNGELVAAADDALSPVFE